jgi:hypothetical protein
MSEPTSSAPRRVLHLIIEGFPEERRRELAADTGAEIFPLTEASAKAALEKIFAADSVAVWSPLQTN